MNDATLKEMIHDAEVIQDEFDRTCRRITDEVNAGRLQPCHQAEITRFIERNFLQDIYMSELQADLDREQKIKDKLHQDFMKGR